MDYAIENFEMVSIEMKEQMMNTMIKKSFMNLSEDELKLVQTMFKYMEATNTLMIKQAEIIAEMNSKLSEIWMKR
jgi:hypothetical protein